MESVALGFEPEPIEPHEPVVFTSKPVRKRKVKRSIKKTAAKVLLVSIAILIFTFCVQRFFEAKRIVWQSPILIKADWQSVLVVRTFMYIENRPVSQKPQIQPVHKAEAAGSIIEVISDKSVLATKPLPEPPSKQPSVASIVSAIHRLESSATNSKGCAAKGEFNGYGYIPGTCYKTQAQVKQLVTKWVEKRIGTMPLNQMLCTYNLGPLSEHLTECMNQSTVYSYYKDYLNL